MDIDARINWFPGMELTAQTFKELDLNLDFRQQVALRAALGGNRLGLLPDAPFECKGVFVKNTYEIERFRCLAVLPSGRLISADEKVVLEIPVLFGDEYYLTVTYGTQEHLYEKDGVPYVSLQKVYALHTLDELDKEDLLPVARFRVADGTVSVDPDYIPPCLLLSADPRFQEFGAAYVEKLEAIAGHPNFEEGEGKRAVLRLLFKMKGYNWEGPVLDFLDMTHELAHAIDYFIVKRNTDKPLEIPAATQFDVQKWLKWVLDYLSGIGTILDGVVLEDNTIDYEALLAQAKAELYERLNPELREQLLLQIKEELRAELSEKLTGALTEYVDGQLKPDLHDSLSSELDPSLYGRLYPELYNRLYEALYVPEEEEEEFYPLM